MPPSLVQLADRDHPRKFRLLLPYLANLPGQPGEGARARAKGHHVLAVLRFFAGPRLPTETDSVKEGGQVC